jgi:hypothetical protein
VVHLSFEGVEALPVREVAFGREANGVDEVFRVSGPAVLRLDVPPVCLEVELGAYDPRVEGRVFLDLKLLLDVFEVGAELVMVRVLFRPCPVLRKLLMGSFVLMGLLASFVVLTFQIFSIEYS